MFFFPFNEWKSRKRLQGKFPRRYCQQPVRRLRSQNYLLVERNGRFKTNFLLKSSCVGKLPPGPGSWVALTLTYVMELSGIWEDSAFSILNPGRFKHGHWQSLGPYKPTKLCSFLHLWTVIHHELLAPVLIPVLPLVSETCL